MKEILIAALASVLTCIGLQVIDCHNQQLIKNYYNSVETLLDSISSQDNYFLDVTMEQDIYFDYLKSKKELHYEEYLD